MKAKAVEKALNEVVSIYSRLNEKDYYFYIKTSLEKYQLNLATHMFKVEDDVLFVISDDYNYWIDCDSIASIEINHWRTKL